MARCTVYPRQRNHAAPAPAATDALGRAAATWQAAAGLLTPIGAITGAALAETLGMRPTLWMLAFGVAVAAATLVAVRRALPGSGTR
jgi:zinc transporter ZupT